MANFVLVHGAWHGGWCWSKVAAILRGRGHTVFTPTQTGLGERSHKNLASLPPRVEMHRICLDTTFRGERHSTGGAAITPEG